MKFCCNTEDLFNFYETTKAQPIKTNDYIGLKKEKDYIQQEFNFDACFTPEKKEVEKKEVEKTENKELVETPRKSMSERNMELMIKYKYDTITPSELNELYFNLEKVVFKIVKNNYVSENFEDVCSEIWRRIAKYKHKFDETKNICVTTWVGKISINVINTIRKKSMTYKARHVSYDGLTGYDKKGNQIEIDAEKIIAEEKDYSAERRVEFYDKIMECFDVFNETEKKIVKLFLEGDVDKLVLDNESRIYKRRYASVSFIKKKLNLTQHQYAKYIKSIGEKYVAKQGQNPNDGIDFGVLHGIL